MQFNSFEFILLFMPLIVFIYFIVNEFSYKIGKITIVVGSVIFYAYSDWKVLKVLCISLVINYIFSLIIWKKEKNKIYVPLIITINVVILLYYKYLNFGITNFNAIFDKNIPLKELLMPIGISFFTFQQIAYVVSIYKKEIDKPDIIDYMAFILYFPKILMGPLTDPVDFIEQLNDKELKKVNWDNIARGIKIFSFGLFKKVMIADVFAVAVNWTFTYTGITTSYDWLLTMLFYTFEIYFDFSGYSDMAVGTSLMLNITLPINFDSPYKALSIRDFWKRWHISLTKFFTKYIYIPLGGNRKGKILTYINIMLIFFISGVWHGANWTFILWGVIHGLFMVFDRVLEKSMSKLFEPLRWILTFFVINLLWLLFRCDSIEQWISIIKTIFCAQDLNVSWGLFNSFCLPEMEFLKNVLHLEKWTETIRGFWMYIYILVAYGLCLIPENNYKNINRLTPISVVLAFIAFVWGFICLSGESVFLYFNF